MDARSAKRAITSASSVSVLAKAAHRAGEVSDLARVNDTERQPNAGQGRRNSGFELPVASSTTRATDSPREAG